MPKAPSPLFDKEKIGMIYRWFALFGSGRLMLVVAVFSAFFDVLAEISGDELARLENAADRWIELERRSGDVRAQWKYEREVLVRSGVSCF